MLQSNGMAAVVQLIQNAETAATLFSPARLLILKSLAEPDCVERVGRAAASSHVISPEALGHLGAAPATSDAARDRFSLSYLVGLAARAIRDLAIVSARAARSGKRVSTMALEGGVRFAS